MHLWGASFTFKRLRDEFALATLSLRAFRSPCAQRVSGAHFIVLSQHWYPLAYVLDGVCISYFCSEARLSSVPFMVYCVNMCILFIFEILGASLAFLILEGIESSGFFLHNPPVPKRTESLRLKISICFFFYSSCAALTNGKCCRRLG